MFCVQLYLGCNKEHLLTNMSDSTRYDSKANTRKDVGVVPLSGVERPAIRECDWVKWTTTGKDAPPLQSIGTSAHHGEKIVLKCVQQES